MVAVLFGDSSIDSDVSASDSISLSDLSKVSVAICSEGELSDWNIGIAINTRAITAAAERIHDDLRAKIELLLARLMGVGGVDEPDSATFNAACMWVAFVEGSFLIFALSHRLRI